MKGYDLLEEVEEEIKKGTAAYTFYVDASNK